MSTELVKAEIARFLQSTEPEVLCINGKWGVGKTYAWLRYLRESEASKSVGLKSYSYVSLFGISSLDALKYSIWESTVPLGHFTEGPDSASLEQLMNGAVKVGRKGRPVFQVLTAAIGLKDAGEALFGALFLGVRNQIVCLDDLERAGAGLDMRDTLGLASMLKEQRKCKVVLLLNEEQLDGNEKKELARQLEKVVDTSLVFDPTPEEAVSIAIDPDSRTGKLLGPRMVQLRINNIRVIKKIERLSLRLEELLDGFDDGLFDQAIATAALGGWSMFQPDSAPSLDLVRNHNRVVSAMKKRRGEDEGDEPWRSILASYDFVSADDLDLVILDGIAAGYFDQERLLVKAEEAEDRFKREGRTNSFARAWDRYHQSFDVDDDEILDALEAGAYENLRAISPMNMAATLRFLREFGREEVVARLVEAYVAAHREEREFFRPGVHMWSDDGPDPELVAAFERERAVSRDERDPIDVLRGATERQGWDDADTELLATLTAEQWQKIFMTIEGPNLRRMVEMALTIGRSGGEAGKPIVEAAGEALRRIAAISPMRRRRVRNYIEFDEKAEPAAD